MEREPLSGSLKKRLLIKPKKIRTKLNPAVQTHHKEAFTGSGVHELVLVIYC